MRISVVIPLYNAGISFRRCLDSVLQQVFDEEYEVIIVDDDSTDDSGMLAIATASVDAKVKVRRLTNGNLGPANARNIGLAMATGEYVFFQDADDMMERNTLSVLLAAARRMDSDLTIGDFNCFLGDQNIRADSYLFPDEVVFSGSDICDLLKEDMTSTRQFSKVSVVWGKLFKRSIIAENRIQFDPTIRSCEDAVFNRDYIGYAKRIGYIRQKVYTHYLNPGQSSARAPTKLHDLLAFKKIAPAISRALLRHGMKASEAAQIGVQAMAFHAVKLTTSFFLNLGDGKIKSGNLRRDTRLFVNAVITDPEIHESLKTYQVPTGESTIIPLLMYKQWTLATIWAFWYLSYRIRKRRRKK